MSKADIWRGPLKFFRKCSFFKMTKFIEIRHFNIYARQPRGVAVSPECVFNVLKHAHTILSYCSFKM